MPRGGAGVAFHLDRFGPCFDHKHHHSVLSRRPANADAGGSGTTNAGQPFCSRYISRRDCGSRLVGKVAGPVALALAVVANSPLPSRTQ